jgi:NitT/TauT family transport system permease protein
MTEDRENLQIRILALSFLIIVWYFVSITGISPLPYPHNVAKTFFSILVNPEPVLGRNLLQHSFWSVIRVLSGASIAFLIAIPAGILTGWHIKLDSLISTVVEIFRPVPPLAWIPLAYLIFTGFSNPVQAAQIFIVFVGAFFPCLLSVREFARSASKELIEMARAFGAGDSEIMRYIIVPSSIPGILSGIRIGLGVGWMSIVAAEMLATSGSGLGYFIMVMYEVGGRAEEIISGIIAIGIIGYIMNEIVLKMEKRLMRWR